MQMSEAESQSPNPPLVLWAYLWFMIAVLIFELCRMATGTVLSFTVPYTGWTIAFPYLFSVFFVFVTLRGPRLGKQAAIKTVRILLVFAIVIGVVDFILGFGGDDFDNPYLRVSPLRPIFTIVVPGAWLLLINGKSVSSYCSAADTSTTHQGTGAV